MHFLVANITNLLYISTGMVQTLNYVLYHCCFCFLASVKNKTWYNNSFSISFYIWITKLIPGLPIKSLYSDYKQIITLLMLLRLPHKFKDTTTPIYKFNKFLIIYCSCRFMWFINVLGKKTSRCFPEDLVKNKISHPLYLFVFYIIRLIKIQIHIFRLYIGYHLSMKNYQYQPKMFTWWTHREKYGNIFR